MKQLYPILETCQRKDVNFLDSLTIDTLTAVSGESTGGISNTATQRVRSSLSPASANRRRLRELLGGVISMSSHMSDMIAVLSQ
jgi:hypothetical protein